MKKSLFITLCLLLLLTFTGCEDPKDVEVTVDCPVSVAKGDEFIITATVKNTSKSEQTLVGLDIGDNYLEGVAITKTEPDNSEASHVPISNIVSYIFDLPVGAGKEITVNLHAKALKTGDFSADIDFCINSDYSFLTKTLRTVVE